MKDTLTTALQYILPHHLLSKWMSFFTHCENKTWKNWMIRNIVNFYKVNMDEAIESDIETYASFNHFFT
ncbi:MAG: phosphatidylserine decarboxylase, partial [Methylococcales bacterium]|nr:phosphatidylserine decarboxylase [Methylococcales bacterium]